MPTVHVEAELSSDELLRALEQLAPSDLDSFMTRAIALQTRRRAPILPQAEAELLLTINEGLSPEEWARYDDLRGKRDAETLSGAEHEELIQLSDTLERLQANRISALSELARLGHTTLDNVMAQLGIQPRDV